MKNLKKYGYVALIVAALIVVFQNTASVETDILFIKLKMPRFVLLVLMLLIGFVVGMFTFRGRGGAKP